MPSPEKRADLDPHDAALKRVREARGCGEPCPPNLNCPCITVTLAALGLDEPPTEAKDDATLIADCLRRHGVIPGRNPDGINDDVAKLVMLVDGLAASNRVLFDQCRAPVVPPAEPPKACPTCGSGWTYHHACPDRGSGIDGGTATRRAAR